MSDKPPMTLEQAHRTMGIIILVIFAFVAALVGLSIYGLAHPSRHQVLLVILGALIVPVILALLFYKAGIRGLLDSSEPFDPKSFKHLAARRPSVILVFPIVLMGLVWGILLSLIGMKKGGSTKEWVNEHRVLTVIWIMTPQLVMAYLCVVLHAPYIGIYIAGCIAYGTVSVALSGLRLENGVVAFFGTYKAQASPLVILASALTCAAAFGVLHFAIWTMWPAEYLNMHGIEDSLYFSVVTMATVGYGDILPVGHLARLLCILEILSGISLLVVGVSASMTVWLQINQPVVATVSVAAQAPPPDKPSDCNAEPVKQLDG